MRRRKIRAKGRRGAFDPMRDHLAEVARAAGCLQRAATGMAMLAELPALREAARAGDAEAIAAGLEALAMAASRVCEGARSVALGAALLDHEARRHFGPPPEFGDH